MYNATVPDMTFHRYERNGPSLVMILRVELFYVVGSFFFFRVYVLVNCFQKCWQVISKSVCELSPKPSRWVVLNPRPMGLVRKTGKHFLTGKCRKTPENAGKRRNTHKIGRKTLSCVAFILSLYFGWFKTEILASIEGKMMENTKTAGKHQYGHFLFYSNRIKLEVIFNSINTTKRVHDISSKVISSVRLLVAYDCWSTTTTFSRKNSQVRHSVEIFNLINL